MAAITICSANPVPTRTLLKGPVSLAGTPVKLVVNRRSRASTTVIQHKVQATLEAPRMRSSDAALSALNEQLEMSKRQFVTALLMSAAGVVLPCCQGAQSARAEPAPAKTEREVPVKTEVTPLTGNATGYMPIKGPCCE
eukprot:TRINITY_DN2158_c0_g1_i1.p1 TRINITY_DN2158_c0_g1~~TRINITY_DN2158_c0_g1_i1.p1  ORF type:complete len:139 (+),score=18.58 TRINITY_DN2158_c0_g1_i1:183-599(+)